MENEIPPDDLLDRVRLFLAVTGANSVTFGQKAAQYPTLVEGLENGRKIGPKIRERVEAYLAQEQAKAAALAAAEITPKAS